MGIFESIWGILEKPASIGGGLIIEIMLFIMPIWTAFLVGLVIGWLWKPKWWDKKKLENFMAKVGDFSVHSSTCKGFSSISQSLNAFNLNISSCKVEEDVRTTNDGATFSFGDANCSSSKLKGGEHAAVDESDLIHLHKIVEEKDGGPSWIQMMDRSTPTMSYRAWRRDPETGPPQYRSSTIFEDATPEMVRDFFWDDEFRPKWDPMLIHHEILEESHTTGTMVVHWIRKFPFFCSDREYIIGRRIWESGRTFYCVTKGIPNSVPRKDKPRRVDLYYSSWCIRPVESKRGTGQMTACEVLLFHHEDMGIPWELAKLGVRQGMWGAVKKIDPGLRAYQKTRAAGGPLSTAASMAHITSKVTPQYLRSKLSDDDDHQSLTEVAPPEKKRQAGINFPKFLVFGGAVALACSLDRGLLTKAVIFGVARKLGRTGAKL
ncbi:hypothetical protein RND81_05G107500 [Saponaria officinalis]|uniref:START domain-containing protein n=1 Tax=Saponaria officinalis TaxID=3572 RepID=A0AAW1KWP2_SAPOF